MTQRIPTPPKWEGGPRIPPSARYGHRWKTLPLDTGVSPRGHAASFLTNFLLGLTILGAVYVVVRSFTGG